MMSKRTITQTFKLNEIKGLIYNEKTSECSFSYNNRFVTGKLVLFKKETGEILVTKEI